MMLEWGSAREIAQAMLGGETLRLVGEELAINDSATVETRHYFVFFYNTRAYLEGGSISHALAGNGPIAVDRRDGAGRWLSSSRPWEEQLDS